AVSQPRSLWRRLGTALSTLIGLIAPILLLMLAPWWLLCTLLLLLAIWLAATRIGHQTWSVAQVGILTIPERLGSSLVVVIGIAGVVGVLVAVLAMGAGFEATLKQTGTDDTVIVMRAGAQTELNSVLAHAYDSEIWGDADIVGPTYRRGSSTTSVTVRLTDAAAFDAFKAALASDPRQ